MSASLPGDRKLPVSRYDLSTYWGRVRHSADIADPRTLLWATPTALAQSSTLLTTWKSSSTPQPFTPAHWRAKQLLDSTLHPDTGQPILLPFRMSCFVLSNLVVTAGMLTPNLTTRGTLFWQIANQSLNVAINTANANKSRPLSSAQLAGSFGVAVGASCGVALGLGRLVGRLRVGEGTRRVLGRLVPFAAVASAGVVNVFLMRGGEVARGIDVWPVFEDRDEKTPGKAQKAPIPPPPTTTKSTTTESPSTPPDAAAAPTPSRNAALLAVSETALSRVINATPIMVLPPLVLLRLQRTAWLAARPRLVAPVNLGLILATSVFALPLALGVFPVRQRVPVDVLEEAVRRDMEGRGVRSVEFNRGM